MVDSSWDNSGLPARKKGLGTGLKIAIGCGVALLLAIGGCIAFVGVGASVVGKQMQAKEWPQLRQVVVDLGSDQGAAGLYQANPGLAADYPSEATFVKASQAWRPRLEPLPAEPPSVFTGRLIMNVSVNNRRRSAELGYRNSQGTIISGRWEDGRLVGLRVD
jgi:hypothetical protein